MTASGLVEVYTHFGGMYCVLSTSGSKSKKQSNFYLFTQHPIPDTVIFSQSLPRELEISYTEICTENDFSRQNSSETNKKNSISIFHW
jgi:hypothetical protein